MREVIQARVKDHELGIRLILSPSNPNQLKMTLDKEKEGDQAVESEGLKILLLSPEIATAVEGMVIDCREIPEGRRFTISKLATDT